MPNITLNVEELEQIEFALNRYDHEIRQWLHRKPESQDLRDELAKNRKILLKIKEAR